MKKLVLALALAGSALFGLAAGSAQAAPLSAAPGAIGAAAESMSIVDTVQYVYGGRPHCWYPSGWKGAGWYVCGNRWRRGYGWGGPAGWKVGARRLSLRRLPQSSCAARTSTADATTITAAFIAAVGSITRSDRA